ncbi:MAG: hypothetical protein QOC93_4158 [Actinomycetota bacterium]|nr:hypothetical protein [Cryptosporangiaceae bacterium]MDQ1679014.1 hypothetical protein [Actinomycetota bacterium]
MTTGPRDTSAAGYLRSLVPVLWPPPASVHIGARRAGDDRTYVLVPSAGNPKLLVPAGSRRAGAAAVRRATEHRTARARARTAVLAGLFRTGAAGTVFGQRLSVRAPHGDTIEDHLAAVLGRPVVLALHIGPARANRKPVFQVLDEAGEPLGFAKVGVDPLTRRLVADEAEALRMLAGHSLRGVEVPAVLHHGSWNGAEILVQSALPVWLPRAADDGTRRVAAMVEVAGVAGVTEQPVRGPYTDGLADRVDALGDRPGGAALAGALAAAVTTAVTLPTGCWHGDWNAGNLATLADRVLIWDWERFDSGVPLGYDALHLDLQTAITVRRVPADEAAASTVVRAAELLAPFGVPVEAAPVVAALYLVELGTRYLADGQAEAGARLGRLGEWLLPVLGQLSRELTRTGRGRTG